MTVAMNEGIDRYGRARRFAALDERSFWAHLSIRLVSNRDRARFGSCTLQTGKYKRFCRPKLKDLML
jgi:hypothetical protein